MNRPGLEILRAVDLRVLPWKNGGGFTTETASRPRGTATDAFDWRVSTAHIARNGPFSLFPGIDRTLAVISGSGLVLEIEGCESPPLSTRCGAFAFAGDLHTQACLTEGPVSALNVMTRNSRFRHEILQVRQPVEHQFSVDVDTAIIVAPNGPAELEGPEEGATTRLALGDALLIESAAARRIWIKPTRGACVWLVILRAVAGHAGTG